MRRIDNEEFSAATTLAREVRANVAEQLRELVIESDRMAGHGDVVKRIELLISAERRIAEARGRQMQAREQGMPVAVHVQAEREADELLRESLMQLGVACAGWVAQMDYRIEQTKRNIGGGGDDG